MATPSRRGVDGYGIVHFDSGAKRTYIWPLCSRPNLDVFHVRETRPITCLECLGRAQSLDWWGLD